MYNFANLSDVEFEYLSKDIMSKKLGVNLQRFAPGRDGGVDLTDDVSKKNIVVQVKHYTGTTFSGLLSKLSEEVDKLDKMDPKPKEYYVCCSQKLTPDNKSKIYNLFSKYMSSANNVIGLIDISDFLDKEENQDVLYAHFKLWIESTNVLQRIMNNAICVDNEALKSDINDHFKFYVQTKAYNVALNILEAFNVVMLIGNPGVGKTLTSEMLVLHFLEEKYQLKYTTATTDLIELKKSISSNRKLKEIILLDDCFGQAYFDINDTQTNELISLIKAVNTNKNKKMILNSRITIYNEAKERNPSLEEIIDKDLYKVYTLDLNLIPLVDKARIFYNHLYFNNVAKEYLENIKNNRNYLQIVKHKNYNPRIIEYVTTNKAVCSTPPSEYSKLIIQCLNNPEAAWRSEYSKRLEAPDRILLNTLYSLTNGSIDESVLRECFNYRINHEPSIDPSDDQFDNSLLRLTDSMVKRVSIKGRKLISAANPSVNDFVQEFLKHNTNETKRILDYGKSIHQFKRLLTESAYESRIKQMFEDESIANLIFDSEQQKAYFITHYCALNSILNHSYESYIHQYFTNPTYNNLLDDGKLPANEFIIQTLLKHDFCQFYGITEIAHNLDKLCSILEKLSLSDGVELVSDAAYLYEEIEFNSFMESTSIILLKLIEYEYESINASDYVNNIEDIVADDIKRLPYGSDTLDYDAAIKEIETIAREVADDELYDIIKALPYELNTEGVSIEVYGASDLLDAYVYESYFEYLVDEYRMSDNELNEYIAIDDIFNR